MNRLQIKAWFGGKNKLDKDNSDAFADAVLVKSDDIITDATQAGDDTTVFSSKATKALVSDEVSEKIDKTAPKTVSLAVASWSTSVNANGFYYYTIADTDVVATDWVDGVFDNSNTAITLIAGMQPFITVGAGTITIESAKIPTAALDFHYKITNGVDMGGGCIVLGRKLNRVYGAIPDGAKDLVNMDYTISSNMIPGSEEVFVNGYFKISGTDYTISYGSTTTITLLSSISTSDPMCVNYDPM